jgi:transposase-like protein
MQSTSSESSPDPTIIRIGSDGRLRYSAEQRREMLSAFERSGQSAMAFCRQHGVAYQTFIAWLRKERVRNAPPAPDGSQAFAEVMLPQGSPSSPVAVRVVLTCGTVSEVASRSALPLAAELISHLRRSC